MSAIFIFAFLSPASSAEPQGRLIGADIRPGVIYAGSRFNIRLSAQNTGSSAWQSYGLKVKLYNSKRKLVKFPPGVNFAYSVTAPWPAGLVYSVDTAIIVPGLNEFIGGSLVSGIYYYLPELFASATASTPAELFRKSPLDRGSLREIRIYNPSMYMTNAGLTAVRLSSSAPLAASAGVVVTLKNFSNTNMSGLTLKLFSGEALVGERAVDILPAQHEKEIEFTVAGLDGEAKSLKLRAVLVSGDDYPEDNYISAEVPFSGLPRP